MRHLTHISEGFLHAGTLAQGQLCQIPMMRNTMLCFTKVGLHHTKEEIAMMYAATCGLHIVLKFPNSLTTYIICANSLIMCATKAPSYVQTIA